MWKYTMEVDGMMCGMCEAHMNDTIRRVFEVSKISSSHTKKMTEFVSKEDISEEALRKACVETGYDIGKITKEPYEKKGFFASLFGK